MGSSSHRLRGHSLHYTDSHYPHGPQQNCKLILDYTVAIKEKQVVYYLIYVHVYNILLYKLHFGSQVFLYAVCSLFIVFYGYMCL